MFSLIAHGATAPYLRNGQRRAKVLCVAFMARVAPYSEAARGIAGRSRRRTGHPPSRWTSIVLCEVRFRRTGAHGVPNRVDGDVDPRRRGAPARWRRWPGSAPIGGSDAIFSPEKDLFLFQSCNCSTARGMVGGPYPQPHLDVWVRGGQDSRAGGLAFRSQGVGRVRFPPSKIDAAAKRCGANV